MAEQVPGEFTATIVDTYAYADADNADANYLMLFDIDERHAAVVSILTRPGFVHDPSNRWVMLDIRDKLCSFPGNRDREINTTLITSSLTQYVRHSTIHIPSYAAYASPIADRPVSERRSPAPSAHIK
jgi:hypothetical protein